ncbi:MAG: hypothetical protein H8E26_14110 [FCB group bacterium]|nr:hypothetical protein [FCB group bacterium]MBL7027418.1 hypothetical protein [Candidatus Neomarinimicrobiota bacterium]MBL7122600.1 hypothetical protein [Candidatus Neomarinimicrobiota bacterium]
MIFKYQIDGVTVSVYNKPKIQLASRDSYAIFQYTSRSVTLSILDTVTISSTSRLKIYQGSVAAANLIWTGDIDWNSRKSDSKTNILSVTFIPDVAKLKTTSINQTYAGDTFEDVMDDIVSALGTGWSWDTNMVLTHIYTYDEEDLDDTSEPNPHSADAVLVTDPFFTKAGSVPYVKFWYDPTMSLLYSKMSRGAFGAGESSISGYTQLAAPANVSTPISGNVGYGFDYDDGPYFIDHHIYFLNGGTVRSYGPQTLIISQMWVTLNSTTNVFVKDLCQFADAYFYVLDKTIYLNHRHGVSPRTITGSVISRKTTYSEVDATLSFSVDYGVSAYLLGVLDTYYSDHYPDNRTLNQLVIINPSARVLPGETLILNGVVEGTVKGVSYGQDRMNIDVDRMGLD